MCNTEEQTMQTIGQFIEANQIEMTAKRIPGRRDVPRSTWGAGARHFVCEIKRVGFGPRDSMIVYFSQGSAHKKPPTRADVLDCLASDIASIDQLSLEDWADELGYTCGDCGQLTHDARRIYQAIEEQKNDLLKLLDQEGLEELLWNTERE